MTTTGEQAGRAAPAERDIRRDPGDEIEVLDGDDIVVELERVVHDRRHGRRRAVVLGAAVGGAVFLAAAGIAIAAHDSGGPSARVRAASAAHHRRAAASGAVSNRPVARHHAPAVAPKPKSPATTPGSVAVSPPVSAASPPPPAVAPAPPVPPAEPISVLTWNATPAALTIPAGGHASLTVDVTNPTNGNVTLGTPLSCAPVLRHAGGSGAAIGGGLCEQLAQIVGPGQHTSARYTIYATDTGDASGKPLPAGRYTLTVENVFSVAVTIS